MANEEYAISEVDLDEIEPGMEDQTDDVDAIGDEFEDDGNECMCERAVKIKDGSQNCLICGLNAYNSQYSFSHTPAGVRLLAEHRGQVDATAAASLVLVAPPAPPRMEADPPSKPKKEPKPKVAKAPKAPKEPKAKKAKEEKPVNQLFEAVKFIALAQKAKADDDMMTHCMIAYGGITAFDRTIACGSVIKEDDLNCLPHTELLLQALSHCGPEYTLVQLPDKLFVQSGDFQAYVPCTTMEKMVTAVPDANLAPLSDTFREAIKTVGTLVKDNGATLLQAAIQLNPYTVIATNGQVIMEAQHGHDMPPNKMLVPKRLADMLGKTKKVIAGFGFNTETFTVHFEDRSWMRTNLYKGVLEYDILEAITLRDALGNVIAPAHKRPISPNFFGAAEEVSKWSSDGRVFLFDDRISSHNRDQQTMGSCRTFAMTGFSNNRIYSIAALKAISKFAISMDDQSSPRSFALFFGNTVRGAIKYDVIAEPKAETPGLPEWTFCTFCTEYAHHNPSHQCRNPACVKFGVLNTDNDDIPF